MADTSRQLAIGCNAGSLRIFTLHTETLQESLGSATIMATVLLPIAPTHHLPGHTARITTVAYSPTQQHLLASSSHDGTRREGWVLIVIVKTFRQGALIVIVYLELIIIDCFLFCRYKVRSASGIL